MTGALLIGFFIANLLGYGGGPSSIPLMEAQIVNHYHWMSAGDFANVLAVANALPGPVATKIAAAVGYSKGGAVGALAALLATIVPSAIALIVMLRLVDKFRQSAVVKGMTRWILPVITVLMGILTWQVLETGARTLGWVQDLLIAAVSLFFIRFLKVHPAFVIVGAFLYGGFLLPHFSHVLS
ncbi:MULTISPECIES: chromate transporter [Alicyclobacillus]|uniref:Chromate transporter n=1 Tax=Alicyclobacillus tolerans TaxID=90970 RepID=A0ABT9LZ02_9BACL|nr:MULTISPECIES: chromate transporter [Alicyclobacillus]MDP9729482.1 chromate transporter [Alicyclobacillus tengchongensis]